MAVILVVTDTEGNAMEGVRLFSRGTTKDHARFAEVARRMCAFVENREPGCRTYECFADAESGQVLWQEAFEDADALLAHIQGLQESGLLEEFMAVYDVDQIVAVTPVTDARVVAVLDQFGAVRLDQVCRLTR